MQKEGIDYYKIFSPIVKHTSIRVILSIVATYNLELEQLDVKTTFLNGELEKTYLHAAAIRIQRTRERRTSVQINEVLVQLKAINQTIYK